MIFRTGGSIAENLRLGDNASNCDFPDLRYSLIFDLTILVLLNDCSQT